MAFMGKGMETFYSLDQGELKTKSDAATPGELMFVQRSEHTGDYNHFVPPGTIIIFVCL